MAYGALFCSGSTNAPVINLARMGYPIKSHLLAIALNITSLQLTATQSAAILVLIMALRMFGLFIAIPVLSVHAALLLDLGMWHDQVPYTDTESGLWIGLVMGGYGLMQFFAQVPSGWLSDKIGRRPVIVYGLICFSLGAMVCELARNVEWLAVGRLMQGVGAVSAASTALLADLTDERTRVRWMAAMGGAISLAFISAFVAGPKLYTLFQFQGFFLIPAYLSVISLILLAFFAEPTAKNTAKKIADTAEPNDSKRDEETPLNTEPSVFRHPALLALNVGVFFLHSAMVGVFVALPWVLREQLEWPTEQHWLFYAWVVPPSLLVALILIWPIQKNLRLNREDHQQGGPTSVQQPILMPAMIALLVLGLIVLSLGFMHVWVVGASMLVFFIGFNVMEALQPSMVSMIAPPSAKGTAMGAYHACQSLGLFAGGLSCGWIFRVFDAFAVFRFNAALIALWLSFALYRHFNLAQDD